MFGSDDNFHEKSGDTKRHKIDNSLEVCAMLVGNNVSDVSG